MWALKELMARLGSDRVECRQDGARLPIGNRSAYVGTARIADLDAAGAVLIVGADPRREAPVLNSRIRKAWLAGAEVGVIGEAADLTYPVHQMGDRAERLTGGNRDRTVGFMRDKAPVVILGQAALVRPDGAAILGHAMSLAADAGAKLMVLHTAASRVGGMDIGFAHADGLDACRGARVIYALGADEISIEGDPFVIYHGSHGDRGAHRADVILPGAAFTEQSGIFVNLEGRPQMAYRASFPPGQAKEDWAILRALSAELGQTLPFDTLDELRRQLCKAHPHLAALDRVPENEWRPLEAGQMDDAPIRGLGADHYLVNPILRASELMAEMSRLAAGRATAMAAE
jgi:NADH-quinone oxidoreductase subunit G